MPSSPTHPPEVAGEESPLPVNTAIFPENRRGGLLLVGINHGYNKTDEKLDEEGFDRLDTFKSFFSDERVQNHLFRKAVKKWFGLWGYELQGDWRLAQPFDRSLVHTNWLQSASRNVDGVNVRRACINDADEFLRTCDELRPGLIIFFSQQLMWAFLSGELRPKVEGIFGPAEGGTEWHREDMPDVTPFRVGFQRFRDLRTVSLPHPTGARGITDKYIVALKGKMRCEIDAWWERHWSSFGAEMRSVRLTAFRKT